jgi:hypothetical protein
MPFYISPQVLLADARLRLDAIGPHAGVIVVEGPDDKRIFYHRAIRPNQVIPAGGRGLLLASYEAATNIDHERIMFVTDCDYAVRAGELSGGPGLAITANTDIEADLLALGLLPKVITEIVPSALSGDQVARVADQSLKMAKVLALPLGRVRMATKPLGVDLGFNDFDFAKYWKKGDNGLDFDKLIRVISDRLKLEGRREDLIELVAATPGDDNMCHGKDLLSALRAVLMKERRLDGKKVTREVLSMMLRIALDDQKFEEWPLVQRIRSWERLTGSIVLQKPSSTCQ